MPDDPSLWGWLTSLFSGGQSPNSGFQNIGGGMYLPTNPSGAIPGTALQAALGGTPAPAGGGWASTGAPVSNQLAPPSMYTAGDPTRQAAWNQASTPQGYLAALASQATRAPAPAAAVPQSSPAAMVRPAAPPYYPAGGMLPSGAAPVAGLLAPYALPGYGISPFGPGQPMTGVAPGAPGTPWGPAVRRSTLTTADLGDITQMTSAQIEAIPDAIYNSLTESQRTELGKRWRILNANR